MVDPSLHAAHLRDLDPVTLYRLLRLRVDVFVVEQECPYPELDGVDLEHDTEQLWLEVDGEPVATLRTYVEDGEAHLGRVATHPDHRGRGYAARLVTEALRRAGEGGGADRGPDLPGGLVCAVRVRTQRPGLP